MWDDTDTNSLIDYIKRLEKQVVIEQYEKNKIVTKQRFINMVHEYHVVEMIGW